MTVSYPIYLILKKAKKIDENAYLFIKSIIFDGVKTV